jgi:hypothetical protein
MSDQGPLGKKSIYTEDTKNEEENSITLHVLYSVFGGQHMHNKRVWNIKHGLVHHSFAAGPAAI